MLIIALSLSCVIQTRCRTVHILFTSLTSDVWIISELRARLQLGNDDVCLPVRQPVIIKIVSRKDYYGEETSFLPCI